MFTPFYWIALIATVIGAGATHGGWQGAVVGAGMAAAFLFGKKAGEAK